MKDCKIIRITYAHGKSREASQDDPFLKSAHSKTSAANRAEVINIKFLQLHKICES